METGELTAWKSEAVAPADWGADFAALKKITYSYDVMDRKTAERVYGRTAASASYVQASLTQLSYDASGRLECTAVRMNSATWGIVRPTWQAGRGGDSGRR